MKKIGIIGAMDSEVKLLRESMKNVSETVAFGITFCEGDLGVCRAVLAKCGIGKVNAAMCAAVMIEKFAPDALINSGCMGALRHGMNACDVVVSADAVEHDLDYAILGDPRGLIYFPDGTKRIEMAADKTVSDKLIEAAKSCGCCVYSGRIASGDRFVYTAEDREAIRTHFRADGCEMEGAAVAHVCTAAGVPFGIVRSVSDSMDGDTHIEYSDFVEIASVTSAKIVVAFAESFV